MIIRHFKIQRYEQTKYQYSSNKPVQFLINKTRIPEITVRRSLRIHTSQFSMTDSLNKEDVMESLIVVIVKKRETRRVENNRLLKLISGPEIIQFFYVSDVNISLHITCMTKDRVWVGDYDNLVLISNTGDSLHHFKDLHICDYSYFAVHTVNSENEVIYIDKYFNINKLSKDMKTTTLFIKTTDST